MGEDLSQVVGTESSCEHLVPGLLVVEVLRCALRSLLRLRYLLLSVRECFLLELLRRLSLDKVVLDDIALANESVVLLNHLCGLVLQPASILTPVVILSCKSFCFNCR